MIVRRMCAVVVIALWSTACGQSEDPASSLPAACGAYVELNAAFFSLPEQDGTAAELERQAQSFAAQAIPLAERVAAGMPSELRQAGNRFANAIRSVGSDRAFDAVDTDEFFSDSLLIGNHLGTNCGFPGAAVEAVDHRFVGLPSTLPAGRPIALNVTNRGSEPHALSILRARDGGHITVADVLATPADQLLQRFDLVSAVSVDEPGQSASLITVLEPGSYVVGCFVHQGRNDAGPTHAAAGMVSAVIAG